MFKKNKKFEVEVLKKNIKLAMTRIELLKKKKTELNRKSMTGIAKLLGDKDMPSALLKTESVCRMDYVIESYMILKFHLEAFLTRISLFSNNIYCDPSLFDSITIIIYMLSLIKHEVPEMEMIVNQITLKLGKKFLSQLVVERHDRIPKKIHDAYTSGLSNPETLDLYLRSISTTFSVSYETPKELAATMNTHRVISDMTNDSLISIDKEKIDIVDFEKSKKDPIRENKEPTSLERLKNMSNNISNQIENDIPMVMGIESPSAPQTNTMYDQEHLEMMLQQLGLSDNDKSPLVQGSAPTQPSSKQNMGVRKVSQSNTQQLDDAACKKFDPFQNLSAEDIEYVNGDVIKKVHQNQSMSASNIQYMSASDLKKVDPFKNMSAEDTQYMNAVDLKKVDPFKNMSAEDTQYMNGVDSKKVDPFKNMSASNSKNLDDAAIKKVDPFKDMSADNYNEKNPFKKLPSASSIDYQYSVKSIENSQSTQTNFQANQQSANLIEFDQNYTAPNNMNEKFNSLEFPNIYNEMSENTINYSSSNTLTSVEAQQINELASRLKVNDYGVKDLSRLEESHEINELARRLAEFSPNSSENLPASLPHVSGSRKNSSSNIGSNIGSSKNISDLNFGEINLGPSPNARINNHRTGSTGKRPNSASIASISDRNDILQQNQMLNAVNMSGTNHIVVNDIELDPRKQAFRKDFSFETPPMIDMNYVNASDIMEAEAHLPPDYESVLKSDSSNNNNQFDHSLNTYQDMTNASQGTQNQNYSTLSSNFNQDTTAFQAPSNDIGNFVPSTILNEVTAITGKDGFSESNPFVKTLLEEKSSKIASPKK